jgi:hypothetical protein
MDELTRLRIRVAALEAALLPFAREAARWDGNEEWRPPAHADGWPYMVLPGGSIPGRATLGDVRLARDLLDHDEESRSAFSTAYCLLPTACLDGEGI